MLAPAPYSHYWMCSWSSLLTGWLGVSQVGLAPLVRSHWVTSTNFMRLLSISSFRAYLGATMSMLGEGTTILRSDYHIPRRWFVTQRYIPRILSTRICSYPTHGLYSSLNCTFR
jgi:hypothetical protein